MPDQSLDKQTNPTSATPSATPDDTSANHPEAAKESSRLANAPLASEGQMQQADVTINRDPKISPADDNDGGTAARSATGDSAGDNYDDENAWPYRALQQEAKNRELDASGKRDELVSRLREADGSSEGSSSVPTSEVDPNVVDNGGIQKTDRGTQHASVLQGLSDQRRQQQLDVVRERASQSEDSNA